VTYDDREKSAFSGAPVEGYRFIMNGEWLYTSADRVVSIAVDGNPRDFEPLPGLSRSSRSMSKEDMAGSVTVKLPRDNEIAQFFLDYGPPEPIDLTIWRGHDGETDSKREFKGRVIAATFEGGHCNLTCAPASRALHRKIPRHPIQVQCFWALYGTGCGVNLNLFKVSATLSSVSGSTIQSATFATKPDGWFTGGFIVCTGSERRYIRSHVGNTLVLQAPISDLVAGNIVDAFAGCDRTEATCETKFANLVNHQGRPRIPERNTFEVGFS
jgi:uncharacterized phage protein (TIGR02218 family)